MLRSELHVQEQEHAQLDIADTLRDNAQVFHAIKERVIEEFGLPKEYIDVLYSVESRFPGDKDIIDSAFYLKYNRAKQGTINEGERVPMHKMPLASLNGTISTLADRLAEDKQGAVSLGRSRPVVLVAGSIT
jgi:hypothetical protein